MPTTPTIATDDLLYESLGLAEEIVKSRTTVAELLEAAAGRLRDGDNVYRVAHILEASARHIREHDRAQLERVAGMRQIVETHVRNERHTYRGRGVRCETCGLPSSDTIHHGSVPPGR